MGGANAAAHVGAWWASGMARERATGGAGTWRPERRAHASALGAMRGRRARSAGSMGAVLLASARRAYTGGARTQGARVCVAPCMRLVARGAPIAHTRRSVWAEGRGGGGAASLDV